MTSCAIITGPAAEATRQLPDRKPTTLDQQPMTDWLDRATPATEAKAAAGEEPRRRAAPAH
jgi:putative SOS response-associated peptidase YedK